MVSKVLFLACAAALARAATTPASYDYIVVGGGTSGAALAARIAEDPSVTVALLEAGDDSLDNNILAYVPGADVLGVGWLPSSTVSYDWNYQTQPQAGALNRRMHYARGKGLGGTSNRNFMLFHRPTVDSFSYWTNATSQQASPGWTWEDVYPYYTKSAVISKPNNARRGAQFTPTYNPAAYPSTNTTQSPLPISFANFEFDYVLSLQGAFKELGYPVSNDFSSGTLNGVQYCPSTINQSNSHRSTSQTFIRNAQRIKLNNLYVILNAYATKINFDSSKTARSVKYLDKNNVTQTISAKREIVVSAGVFNSPALLMLSGIGPAAQLQKFGIPVISDLPGVGQNFQDHIFFSPAYEIKPNIYNFGHEANLLQILFEGIAGVANTGSLTNPVSEYLGWQRVNDSYISSDPDLNVLGSYPPQWPHIEYIAAGGLVQDFSDLLTLNVNAANKGKYYYSLETVIIAPQSRGSVTLASADPKILPNIDPAWLTSRTDQLLAVEMYRKVRRLFNTTSFRSARNNNQEYFPGYNVTSDEDILNVIRGSLQTLWHGACTCAMQPRENNGVLDPYLRVYGVNGLRVVDASSFPSLLPGHPQATLYMLAERAADFLKLARGAPINVPKVSPPAVDPRLPFTGN